MIRRAVVVLAAVLAAAAVLAPTAGAVAPTLDLENMSIAKAETMMSDGQLTAVQLTQAYINRINALNQHGPSLNAVRILNPNALSDAAQLDNERAHGIIRGPLEGVPVIVKDNIDVAGLPTTAGDVALANSIPTQDAPIVASMRAAGAVILGKANLAEFAFFLSNTPPNGYGGVEGQVLNAYDPAINPGGSSSGPGAIAASGMALVTIGSDTGGSIIQPAAVQGVVGLRPTMGLLSRRGIVPISASQDTAGPIVQNVADAAAVLQATAGADPLDSPAGYFGPGIDSNFIVLRPPFIPNYMAALDPNALIGKRIGVIASTDPNYLAAVQEIQHLGAITVTIPIPTVSPSVPAVLTSEFKRDLNNYLAALAAEPGANAPMHSLADIIAFNTAHAQDVIKYGQTSLVSGQAVDLSDPATFNTYAANLVNGKNANRAAIDNALTNNNLASFMLPAQQITGTNSRGGYVQLTIPAGYAPGTRRPVNISFHGGAFSEAAILGIGYAYEQGTHDPSFTPVVGGVPIPLARQAPDVINPSFYRCAPTFPASPFAARGSCPPGPELLTQIGTPPALGFSLEGETASDLESRLHAHTLSSVDLTKAYMARIAVANASGLGINAVRAINPQALSEAALADADIANGRFHSPLEGVPVLINDNLDVLGMPTTAGSVALDHSLPGADAAVVAKLKAAGAVILGTTNTTELGGGLSSTMPQSYSSLGGEVLNPYDLQVNPGGSSAGAGSATAAGFAAAAIGTESGSGGLVTPAATMSDVALRPTIGLVSRSGELAAGGLSQDTPGPVAKTVTDAAAELQAIAGPDAGDPATTSQPPVPDYLSGLTLGALSGKRIGVITSTDPNYNGAVAAIQAAGATTVTVTAPSAITTPTVTSYEFKRDVNAYLGGLPSGAPAGSLADIISYDSAHAAEALKYPQDAALASQAVDTSPGSSDTATYTANLAAGRATARGDIDGLLSANNLNAIMTPSATLTAIASRAGYPQLIVPAGYNDLNPASQTRNPVSVSFVGTAFSEAELLDDGYALEQALPSVQQRRVPSATNVDEWDCTPGNAYTPSLPLASYCPPSDVPPQAVVAMTVGGTVPPTLGLSVGSATASLGTFMPGTAATYTTQLAATVTSSGGNATLTAQDPSGVSTGHLVNGTYALPQALQVKATNAGQPTAAFAPLTGSASPLTLLTYGGPTANDPVTVGFAQPIAATDALRSGNYGKTIVLTLSTTAP